MPKIHPFKVYHSVFSSIFTRLCAHHHCLTPEHSHHPKRKPHTHLQSLPTPLPQPLATTNLLSVSMDLPILDISQKWSYSICGLLCLAAFTPGSQICVHVVSPCCFQGMGRSRQHEMGTVPKSCLLIEGTGAVNLDSISEYESLRGGSQQLERNSWIDWLFSSCSG